MAHLTTSPENFILTNEMKSQLIPDGVPVFIGIDLETTGLEAENHHILSVAILLADKNFNPIGDGLELIVHQSEENLNTMDDWCRNTHTKSGLIEQVRKSALSQADVEYDMVAFLRANVPNLDIGNARANLPMAGNSIYLDRRFLEVHMSNLFRCFHYRSVDASTIKEIVRHQRPELFHSLEKSLGHTAMADIVESFEELRIYNAHFFHSSPY